MTKAIKKAQNAPLVRQQASATRKELWKDGAYRTRVVEAVRRHHSSPEARVNFAKLLSDRWNDPAFRAKMIAGNRESHRTPEYRARQGALTRARWASDEYFRATVLEANRLYQASPESRAIKSARMKALWADPVWKMRQQNLVAKGMAQTGTPLAAAAAAALNTATDLMAAVDRVVPRGLPEFIRADVSQDMMVALLDGSLKIGDLKNSAKTYLAEHRKMFPDMFGPISLDASLPGTDGLKLMDIISNDAPHF